MTIYKMYATYALLRTNVFFIAITLFQSASVQFSILNGFIALLLQPLTRTNLIKPWRVECSRCLLIFDNGK